MAFVVPEFPLFCAIAELEPSTPPRLVGVACNLAWGRRVNNGLLAGPSDALAVGQFMTLLLPAHTDIRDGYGGSNDVVEVPEGSGRWYTVFIVDDIGKGFDNEHRAAVIMKLLPWPVPIP